MTEITGQTKIHALLTEYPQLEDVLIAINPQFQKLKNPILRRTIGRVASLQQVAATVDVPLTQLLNKLRIAVGDSSE